MKPEMESGSSSPTLSAEGENSAQSRPRQKQVPIARNTGSGYERLERARTSHACEPCRERKTKCDGERPSCRRCLHTGTGCHYGYGKGWKKRKTAEDLTATSRKLARYEALLSDIFPLVDNGVRSMIEQARQQEYVPMTPNEQAEASIPGSAKSFEGELGDTSPLTSRLPLPPPLSVVTSVPSPFDTTPRTLTSQHSNISHLSTSSTQRMSRSPPQDFGNNSAIKLPSITRQGILVDDTTSNQIPRGPIATAADVRSLLDQRITMLDIEPLHAVITDDDQLLR